MQEIYDLPHISRVTFTLVRPVPSQATQERNSSCLAQYPDWMTLVGSTRGRFRTCHSFPFRGSTLPSPGFPFTHGTNLSPATLCRTNWLPLLPTVTKHVNFQLRPVLGTSYCTYRTTFRELEAEDHHAIDKYHIRAPLSRLLVFPHIQRLSHNTSLFSEVNRSSIDIPAIVTNPRA